jgi:hypothetical protein
MPSKRKSRKRRSAPPARTARPDAPRGYARSRARDDEARAALEPLAPGERGHGARTRAWVEGIPDPIVASRTERAIVAAMGANPSTEQSRIVDEALDLAQRVAAAAEQGRFDVGDLAREFIHMKLP